MTVNVTFNVTCKGSLNTVESALKGFRKSGFEDVDKITLKYLNLEGESYNAKFIINGMDAANMEYVIFCINNWLKPSKITLNVKKSHSSDSEDK